MKKKTVIFDIGNVLIRFRWIDFIHELFDDEETIRGVEDAMWMSGLWNELDRGVVSEEMILKDIISRRPEYAAEIQKTFDHVGDAIAWVDYAIPWIRSIKAAGHQVLFLSNYSGLVRRANEDALDFLPLMDGGIFSYEAGLVKPDPNIYQKLVDDYHLDPHNCLFIDDNKANVRAANALGIPAVRFKDYEQGHAAVEAFLKNETAPFRPMRRIRQQLPEEECIAILERASDGVLALNGDAGYNYAVPLNFAYRDGCIHFHCAKKGHKIDAIRRNPRVSFCVVDANDVDAEGMATDYRSVILFGYARILEDPEEIRASARLIGEKYSSAFRDAYEAEIDREFPALACVEIRIEHITGKEGKALSEKHRAVSSE